jgi:hypothetical protein
VPPEAAAVVSIAALIAMFLLADYLIEKFRK